MTEENFAPELLTVTDENGESRHYAISISGKDGSLICSEYLPA